MRITHRLVAALLVTLLAACGDSSPSSGGSGGSGSGASPLTPAPLWTIGTSVDGLPLVVEHFGDTGPRVLLLAAIHGNERPAVLFGERMRTLLLGGAAEEQGVQVVLLQAANPDGVQRASRANAHGIDLNRNFPAQNFAPSADHGQAPLQEPESAALAALIESLDPVVIVSVHNPLDQMDWNGPADALAKQMAADSGIPLEPPIGGLPGSLGSWAGDDLGIPIITMELPQSVESLPGYDGGLVAVRTALSWAAAGEDPSPAWEPEQTAPSPWGGELLVTSAGGRLVRLDRVGDGARKVLVVGALEGSDTTAFVAERLRGAVLLRPQAASFLIVTSPNPDGLLTGTGTNADGQQVARGFPADGEPEAPEAQALLALLRAEEPDVVVVVEAGTITGAAVLGGDDALVLALAKAGLPELEAPPEQGTFAARASAFAPVVRLLVPAEVGTEWQAQPYQTALLRVSAL